MPRLSVNRMGRAGMPVDDCLFAVTAEDKGAVRLVCVNLAGLKAGLSPGMTLADARGIAPDLVTLPEEPQRDMAFLKALQRWAEKFSPWTSCDGTDGLLINITGCAHLFDGEEAMRRAVLEEFSDLQVEAAAGIADTKGAARAVARFGLRPGTGGAGIIQPGETRAALAAYPIEALGIDDKTIFELKRLGLKTIGELYPLKSAELTRRFGFGLLRTFEKLMGATGDPVIPASPLPGFAARISFPDPIGLQDDVEEALRRLIAQVCKRLSEQGHGVRALRLSFQRADKSEGHLDIGLARPSQDAGQIFRQFRLKLGTVDAGYGIDMMRLQAIATEPFRPVQQRFATAEERSQLDELIATLGNRLGFDRVLSWEPVSSHLPHRAFRFVEAAGAPVTPSWASRPQKRPLMLVGHELVEIIEPGRPPQAFKWRQDAFDLAGASGPERIGHEWWKGADSGAIRDYWSVQTKQGMRLWLSTRPDGKPPSWEVAGVFP
ncbi:Y-family DNA polymerase [Aquisalinus flavus]|nr:DNA polymerase Y family protein [Aquisalinus flavus]